MKILVYSGTSLVGRNIVLRLAEQRHHVICTYRTQENIPCEFRLNRFITLVQLSHSEISEVDSRFDDIDAIINSTGAYPTSSVSDQDVIYANIKTSLHIISTYQRNKATLKCIVNYSSLSVYGDLNGPVFSENTRPSPLDLYGSTKLIGEQILDQVREQIPVYHLRFPVVLGRDSHRAWLPSTLKRMRLGKNIYICNKNSLYNCCTGMEDVLALTVKILSSVPSIGSSNIYPLGSIPDISIQAIIGLVAAKANFEGQIDETDNGIDCCYIDYSNALQIGYKPRLTSEVIRSWLSLN